MEETAEDFLEELVQRSLIQVSKRHLNGSIKYCRIHDLLLELAIKKGKENKFLDIVSIQDGTCSSSTVTRNMRHAALHCDLEDIMETTGPNLRSLIKSSHSSIPESQIFRFLKVLYAPENRINNFQKLAQLRYIEMLELGGFPIFNICNCGLTLLVEREFRKSMSRVRNLQTINISTGWGNGTHLIDYIWNIKTLRHVILPENCYGPPSKANLPNLQTLKFVMVRKEWMDEGWPIMPNLRVLRIYGRPVQPNYGESLCSFLRGLHRLTFLHLMNFDEPLDYDMRDMSVFPWYNHLQSLSVTGKWMVPPHELGPVMVTTSSFPIHLTKLKLYKSRIKENPMLILGKLESLKLLTLGRDAYVGTKLYCSVGGFPCLQFLSLENLYALEEWKADVEEGAMPMLKEIELFRCRQLRLIPRLRYMASLRKFTSYCGSTDLHRSLREDESHKIRDGQFVQMEIEE